ncbi:hypothetical protein ABZY93_10830 [Streptomyces smyrnaeus]
MAPILAPATGDDRSTAAPTPAEPRRHGPSDREPARPEQVEP